MIKKATAKLNLIALLLLSFFVFSSEALATKGNLYTDSIVTCNGKTYGQHNGHWHEAKQNVKGIWYAAHPNDELKENPCNSSFESTGGNAIQNESTTPSENPSATDSVQPTNTSESTTQKTEGPESEEQKTNETVELRVWVDNSDSPIVFSNNTYTAKSRNYWQRGLDFAYQFSSGNASLKIEKNGEQIKEPIELDEGDNKIKLIVETNSGEEITLEINVKRETLFISLATLVVVCTMSIITLGASAIAIKVYIIDQKNKKNNKKIPVQKFFKSLLKKDNIIKILIPPYYAAIKEKRNKKASNYLSYWIVIWLITIISVVAFFMNSSVKSSNNVNLTNSPSVTFTIEITELNDSGATKNESEDESSTSLNNDVMSGIIIAEATSAQYSRNEYEPNWDVGSGCNIRARILQKTSLVAVKTSSNGCTVTYGSWVDPYTGETLTGNPYQGDDGTSNDLDIDHIIPLKYVNSHGGSEWSHEQKRSYGSSLSAMEKGVYVAVSASENRKKGDSGPSEYYPPNDSYRCEYAQKWRDIAKEYSISLSLNDYNTILNVLISCAV